MFYIFHGEDEFSRSEDLARLKSKMMENGTGELNTTVYDGRSVALGELINACNTLPFFTSRRLIIVNDMLQRYERRSTGAAAEEVSSLVAYLPKLPETTRLVFDESVELSDDRGILPAVRGLPNAYIKAFPLLNRNNPEDARRLNQWISARARLKGTGIEPAAISRLVEYVGNDLRRLDTELEKLAGHAAYSREIRVEDVLTLVSPDPEARVYELLDAVGLRRRSAALKSLHNLVATEMRYADGLYPLAMLVVRFGELLTVKDLSENQHLTDQQIRAAMNLKDWQYRRLPEQSRQFTSEELVQLVQRAREIDQGIKTGELDAILSLEMLIIEATHRRASAGQAQRDRKRSRTR